jgi:hypothetical protein
MPFRWFVQIRIEKAFGPEALWFIVFVRRVCNRPVIVCNNGACGDLVPLVLVVFREGMWNARGPDGGSINISVNETLRGGK